MAVITTAWLPDSIAGKNIFMAGGTVFYLVSVIFVTAWVYGPTKEKTPITETLVYGLSGTTGWDKLDLFSCEDMERNRELDKDGRKVRLNLIPLYISIWLHAYEEKTLKRIFLLYTRLHSKKEDSTSDSNDRPELDSNVKENLRKFFKKTSGCMNVAFKIHWPKEKDEEIEVVGSGERTIDVHFIYVGSGNDVLEVKKKLGEDEKLQELLKKESEKVVFHVTGGTAVMTAVMMFEAIKGDARAEYTVQGKQDKDPNEIIKSWDITPDMIPDFWQAVEWFFERQGL